MVVIFQNLGTDFPPIAMNFDTRSKAVDFILNEVAKCISHKMDSVTVNDARKILARYDSFSMIEAGGSKYIWMIQP
ncbi:MAG: hypothetical protein ACI4RA_07730 [Kiritimatiellia bacterium]